ncbi:hypothetical protein BDD12DRAFT_831337 [Trichophaea hybrida]|nr:hypothetical protein BDD12DRAFT_831337 [Trichophaea hybrida]
MIMTSLRYNYDLFPELRFYFSDFGFLDFILPSGFVFYIHFFLMGFPLCLERWVITINGTAFTYYVGRGGLGFRFHDSLWYNIGFGGVQVSGVSSCLFLDSSSVFISCCYFCVASYFHDLMMNFYVFFLYSSLLRFSLLSVRAGLYQLLFFEGGVGQVGT